LAIADKEGVALPKELLQRIELWHLQYIIVLDAMIKLTLFISGYELIVA